MNMQTVALIGAGVGLAALVGAGAYWWHQRNQKKQDEGPKPSAPPRAPTIPVDDLDDEIPNDERPSRADITKPTGHVVERMDLDPELEKVLNVLFSDTGWPPDEQTINKLDLDDAIVFGVESDEIGNYTETRQELISAKVLSVEKSEVRARIYGQVKYAEHHGSFAGHGFRIGDLLELPRSQILVAAKPDLEETGYGSQGNPALVLEPSSITKKLYTVKAGTPYDLVLPYRTHELAWYVDRELVKLIHIGEHKLLEQVMFSEDSLRGDVSVRALDEDPEHGTIFVARWDFVIES